MVKIDQSDIGHVRVLKPKGNLDIMTYQKIKEKIIESMDVDGKNSMVIDMCEVEYVASSGWAVLISQARRSRRQRGGLAVCNLKAEIQSVYETMGIETILPSGESVEDAIAALKEHE